MSTVNNFINKVVTEISTTRRSFIKGLTMLGLLSTTLGCERKDNSSITMSAGLSDDPYFSEPNKVYRYGTTAHNCGGRCVTQAEVHNGRIVRFFTDNSTESYDGSDFDISDRNSPQAKACSRCRGYKGRLYHPGRLKYPLKQTKQRGDMSGFVRISWDEALKDIATKLKAVQQKYGPEAFHPVYACGNIYSNFQSAGYNGVLSVVSPNAVVSGAAPAIKLLGGATSFAADYSYHQYEFMGGYGVSYSGLDSGDGVMAGQITIPPTANDIVSSQNRIVLWGSNIVSTVNPLSNSWVKSMQDMKKSRPDSKVYYIGPEFSDTGITVADEWIQIRPYTDVALILAIIYELVATDKLDMDYIDTMVYGFSGSPEYWLHGKNRTILTETPNHTVIKEYLKIDAVPAGESFLSYILGNGELPTSTKTDWADYSTEDSTNYTARSFGASNDSKKRFDECSYKNSLDDKTKYLTKADFKTPKTPEWASKISGIPASKIRELALIYSEASEPAKQVWNEWAGGQLKQSEGCSTIFALQVLNIVVKNWGVTGAGVARGAIAKTQTVDPKMINIEDVKPKSWKTIPPAPQTIVTGATQWNSAVKFAFGDMLKHNGYKPNTPDWSTREFGTGKAYYDDGGVKGLVKRIYDENNKPKTFKDKDNNEYYQWIATDGTNVDSMAKGVGKKPVYSGFRFILNSGGNIPVNQHCNALDSVSMYENLPTHGYSNKRLNVANMSDAFYLVSFDNFMSASPRYSDYVLPAKTSWEQADFRDLFWGNTIYQDEAIAGPGESKSTWDFARDLIVEYGGEEEAKKFAPELMSFKEYFTDYYKKNVEPKNSGSAYAGKTFEEFLEKPFLTNKPNDKKGIPVMSDTRIALEDYLSKKDSNQSIPFTFNEGLYTSIITRDAYTLSFGGFGGDQYSNPTECPNQSGRFHVYSGSLVWRYKNAYNKWHAYLSESKRGQNKLDGEGDDIVYPIPMYFAYEDYFIDAYGLKNEKELAGRFLVTTTHDKFRAHSSQSENPYLRELTTRTVGGELYSGNDSGTYAISSNPDGDMNEFPAINSLINKDGRSKVDASYAQILINDEDAKEMKIKNGMLLDIYNEIGTVRVIASITSRCVRGFLGLHQGFWFDPRKISGKVVDVGGNCNTIMASKPSRYDHGNAQQSAMVMIKKVKTNS